MMMPRRPLGMLVRLPVPRRRNSCTWARLVQSPPTPPLILEQLLPGTPNLPEVRNPVILGILTHSRPQNFVLNAKADLRGPTVIGKSTLDASVASTTADPTETQELVESTELSDSRIDCFV